LREGKIFDINRTEDRRKESDGLNSDVLEFADEISPGKIRLSENVMPAYKPNFFKGQK